MLSNQHYDYLSGPKLNPSQQSSYHNPIINEWRYLFVCPFDALQTYYVFGSLRLPNKLSWPYRRKNKQVKSNYVQAKIRTDAMKSLWTFNQRHKLTNSILNRMTVTWPALHRRFVSDDLRLQLPAIMVKGLTQREIIDSAIFLFMLSYGQLIWLSRHAAPTYGGLVVIQYLHAFISFE